MALYIDKKIHAAGEKIPTYLNFEPLCSIGSMAMINSKSLNFNLGHDGDGALSVRNVMLGWAE
jgi:hypothetical protein